ncbi:MAG: hypothetical protein H6570_13130 [Lewinellaceae bacterium]|nr:hypothetical protein [Lewinellaceae bacterium]
MNKSFASIIIFLTIIFCFSCYPFAINDKNCDYDCDDYPAFYSDQYIHHSVIVKITDRETNKALPGIPLQVHKVKTDWNECGQTDASGAGDGTCRYFITQEKDFSLSTDASGNALIEFEGDYDHDMDHYEITILANDSKDPKTNVSYFQAEVNTKLEDRKTSNLISIKLLNKTAL